METAGAGNAAGGVTLPGPVGAVSSIPPSFSVSVGTDSVGSSNFTAVTEDSYYSNGSLGTLKIPAIDLTVKIYQGTSDATLKKGAGHFASTSVWDGNVSLAAHNRGPTTTLGKSTLWRWETGLP